MNTPILIIKCTDEQLYTHFGVFSLGISFDIEITGSDFIVNLYDMVRGDVARKRYDIFVQFHLEDIHDYIRFCDEDDDFLERMTILIRSHLEGSIESQLSQGNVIIDLTDTIRTISKEMTEKANAHLETLLAKSAEEELYD